MRYFVLFSYIFTVLIYMMCTQSEVNKKSPDILPIDSIGPTYLEGDTLIQFDNISVHIYFQNPKHKKGTLLLLHGWNLPATDWCNKTSLCDSAKKYGYCIVMPNLGKSNYQTTIYPETKPGYRTTKGLYWLTDTLLPQLQNLGLLLKNEQNYLVGLSTGARGVILVAERLNDLFTAAAALSGDYDQSAIPNDKVHIGFWGNYEEFSVRWKEIENPMSKISQFQTPIYIGHGKNDMITPYNQSVMLYDTLQKINPTLKVILHLSEAEHDYDYWNSEVKNIVEFFGWGE